MRIRSFDLLKTVGIVAFIIWHCYVNFYGALYNRSPFMRSTLFATGLFIFLSGATIGLHYHDRLVSEKINTILNIFYRCIKLLFIVFLANIVIGVVSTKTLSLVLLANIAQKMISILHVDRWDISLQVLLVIAAGMLFNSIVVPVLIRLSPFYCKLISVTPLFLIFVFDWGNKYHLPYFWRYLPLAYFGALSGIVTYKIVNNKLLSKVHLRRIFTFSIFLFGALWVPVIVSGEIASNIVVETLPYYFMILSFYSGFGGLAFRYLDNGPLSVHLNRGFFILGEYSLFVYLLQIVLINISVLLLGGETFSSDIIVLSIALGITILCFLATNLIDRLRSIYPKLNKVYKSVCC